MEYGGGGYSTFEVVLAQEAVGRVCPDTAHVLSRSSMGAPRVIAELGNDYLKERYLERTVEGDWSCQWPSRNRTRDPMPPR